MVKLLLLIYGRFDGRALEVGKPTSSSARCQAFYSLLHKVHEHSIANCLSIVYSALVVQVVQLATVSYTPYSTSLRVQVGNIIMFTQFE